MYEGNWQMDIQHACKLSYADQSIAAFMDCKYFSGLKKERGFQTLLKEVGILKGNKVA